MTNPTFFGLPLIYISGFTNLGGGNWPRFVGPSAYTEFLDHVSYLRGKHAFKFGGEVTIVGSTGAQVHDPKGRINFRNDANFTSLENFLLGNVGDGSSIFVGQPVRNLHDRDYALFIQDDYRVRPTLTVNLGLRYELQTVLTDANNLLGNFDPNTPTGFVQVGSGENSAYNGDHQNFSPRIGLAWDVRGNGKTVVRAGASILHEFAPLNQIRNQLGNVPTGAQLCQQLGSPPVETCVPGPGTIASGDVSPDPSILTTGWQSNGATPVFANAGQLTCSDSAPCATTAFERNLRIPYFVSWSLDVQRMLTNNLSLEVAYLGNHGVKLLGLLDLNAPPLGSGGAPLPYGTEFPYLSNINYMSNMYRSHYNAMQVVLTQRTSHGLSFTAAYTYSHATDDMSANDANVPLDNANPGLQYGNSDYDIRHHFTLDGTYALPSRKSPGQILQGWEIGSIVTLQTGTPWSPQDMSNDFSGTGEVNNPATYGETWSFFGNTHDFQANPNGIPFFGGPVFPSQCIAHASMTQLNSFGCYMKGSSVLVPPEFGTFGNAGRNIFNEAPLYTWDFSILKNWKFNERLNVQFRAEFFNVLNHPVLGSVDAGHLANNDPSVGSNTFGAANETADQAAGDPILGSGANRVIQLGLKLTF